MSRKSLSVKKDAGSQGATVLRPGDFPIGSPQSRAAARLWLQGIGGTGEGSPECICFPEDEQAFFCDPDEERIAASVKCPLHGERFKQPIFHLYVAKWRRDSEPLRRTQLSPQYQKAWAASFPSDPQEANQASASSNRSSTCTLRSGVATVNLSAERN
jgi:hypothetical protein